MKEFLDVIEDTIKRRNMSVSAVSKIVTGNPSAFKNLRNSEQARTRRSAVDNLQLFADYLGLEFYLGQPRELGFSEAAETFQGQAQEKGWVFLHPKQAEILDGPAPIERMRYADKWFEERGMTPETTALIFVDETGMQPTLLKGTTVVIDTADTEIGKAPTLQATAFGRLIRIRRVEHHDGLTLSRPDNPRHLVDTYSKSHGDLFTALGRVRAVVSEFI